MKKFNLVRDRFGEWAISNEKNDEERFLPTADRALDKMSEHDENINKWTNYTITISGNAFSGYQGVLHLVSHGSIARYNVTHKGKKLSINLPGLCVFGLRSYLGRLPKRLYYKIEKV